MAGRSRRTLSRRSFNKVAIGACLAALGPFRELSGTSRAASGSVFPGKSWAIAPPESQGVDRILLNQAMAYLASVTGKEKTTQAMVIRNGYLIWRGSAIHKAHNIWSASKTFTMIVLGLLIKHGKVSLDTQAADYAAGIRERYPNVTLRHLATMTSGYDAVGGDQSSTPFDPAPPLFAPGGHFLYWDAAMNQLGNVLTRAAGETLKSVFTRHIGEPIGLFPDEWDWGDWGEINGLIVNGGAGNQRKGIFISANNFARVGLLFLNRGAWNGEQLLTEDWVDAATNVQVPRSVPLYAKSSGPGVYGFNLWVNGIRPNGTRFWSDAPATTFKASGRNDNRLWVVPDWNMVIVRLGTSGGSLDLGKENTFLRMIGETLHSSRPEQTSVVVPATVNLLKNSGFESDTNDDNCPDEWVENSSLTCASTVRRDGRHAGKIQRADGGDHRVAQIVCNLEEGKRYAFSGFVNVPPMRSTFTLKIRIRWQGSSGDTIATRTIKTFSQPTNGWTEVTATCTAPRGTVQAQILIAVRNLNGAIYVDDFALWEREQQIEDARPVTRLQTHAVPFQRRRPSLDDANITPELLDLHSFDALDHLTQ